MIVFKFKGGLGNQLFQFAAYEKLRGLTREKIYVDISDYSPLISRLVGGTNRDFHLYNLGLEGTKIPTVVGFILTIISKLLRKNSTLPFILTDFVISRNFFSRIFSYVDNYFQSIEVYDYCEKGFGKKVSRVIVELASMHGIDVKEIENTVAIHIRRGDYVTNSKNRYLFGICSLGYYKKSYEMIVNSCLVPILGADIFTDDPDNIELFNFNLPVCIVKSKSDLHEFIKLAMYKNIVISNSTFGWWAAYLGKSDKMVARPYPWFDNWFSEVFVNPVHWSNVNKID